MVLLRRGNHLRSQGLRRNDAMRVANQARRWELLHKSKGDLPGNPHSGSTVHRVSTGSFPGMPTGLPVSSGLDDSQNSSQFPWADTRLERRTPPPTSATSAFPSSQPHFDKPDTWSDEQCADFALRQLRRLLEKSTHQPNGPMASSIPDSPHNRVRPVPPRPADATVPKPVIHGRPLDDRRLGDQWAQLERLLDDLDPGLTPAAVRQLSRSYPHNYNACPEQVTSQMQREGHHCTVGQVKSYFEEMKNGREVRAPRRNGTRD